MDGIISLYFCGCLWKQPGKCQSYYIRFNSIVAWRYMWILFSIVENDTVLTLLCSFVNFFLHFFVSLCNWLWSSVSFRFICEGPYTQSCSVVFMASEIQNPFEMYQGSVYLKIVVICFFVTEQYTNFINSGPQYSEHSLGHESGTLQNYYKSHSVNYSLHLQLLMVDACFCLSLNPFIFTGTCRCCLFLNLLISYNYLAPVHVFTRPLKQTTEIHA